MTRAYFEPGRFLYILYIAINYVYLPMFCVLTCIPAYYLVLMICLLCFRPDANSWVQSLRRVLEKEGAIKVTTIQYTCSLLQTESQLNNHFHFILIYCATIKICCIFAVMYAYCLLHGCFYRP